MRPMKDPAPSRLAYKLNRMMLRRRVRLFLKLGLPVLIVASLGALWASDPARVLDSKDRLAELRRQVEERPEFMVRMMAIENASAAVAADIREVLSLDFPVSSFDLDMPQLREWIEELDAVASASVQVKSGGVLSVDVTERVPVAVWRTGDGLQLIDGDGHRVVGIASRVERPELPLVVGIGADAAVDEMLTLFAASTTLSARLRGFLRVGERRWDVVLDRDQRIMLPEEGALMAFQRILELDKSQDLFARDVSLIDFRNPGRPIVRLGSAGMGDLFETDFKVE